MNTLTLLMLCLLPALQDTGWRDTHRVHLRNGNFLDGVLVQFGEKDVLFRWSPGVLIRIKIDDIKGNIEEIKIRTLHSKPKEIPLRETPVAPDAPTDVKPPVRDPSRPATDIDKFFTKLLADGDITFERIAAEVKRLGPAGGRAMIAEVEQMDAQRTSLVFMSLDQMREEPLDAEIRGLLESKRPDIRAGAISLLANRPTPEAFRAVTRMLKDPTPSVRMAALFALPNFNDSSSMEAVADLAVDPDPQVRARAIRGAEEMSVRNSADNDLVRKWVSLLGSGPPESVADVAAGIGRLADRAGAEFPTEDVRYRLTQLLSFREPQARASAAYALTSVKPAEESGDAILSALDGEREPKVIVTMCDALGKIRFQKAVDSLVEKLREDNKDVKAAAQRALVKMAGNAEFGTDYDKWREWADKNRGQNP